LTITAVKRSFGELLLYYSFDTENGTVVQNDGSLENGTAVGGVTYVDSRDETFGRAFFGNRAGANDAYVQTGLAGIDLGMGASSASGGVYTAMAWVNWNGTTSLGGGQGDHMIFGAEDGPGNNAMLHLGIRDETDGSHAHYGGWGNDLNNGGIVTPGEWTHLTFQYDGTDKVIYVNGEETLRGAGGPLGSEALPVIVGGHGRDAPDPAGMSFNGAMDEVKVFDEALTEEMIQAAMIPSVIADTDGDGLSDADERNLYNSDPNDSDSDDDGIDDGSEVRNGLNPNSAVGDDGASGDPDGDTLTNLEEIETHKTDPLSQDSDDDGLDDAAELQTHGTDPNNPDSDDDTLSDGQEIEEYETNPNDPDSDDDGFPDAREIEVGTDPNDAGDSPSVDVVEPILYYSFDDEGVSDVENLGSLGTPGRVSGGVTYVDSKDGTFGRAFSGNRTGANDAYIQTGFSGTQLSFGAGSTYTAMAWINWNGTTSLGGGEGDHMIFGAEDGPGNNAMLHHGIRDEADGSHAHYGGWGNDLNNGGVVTPGEWTHLTFQYDGTDKVIYVNGEETLRGAGGALGSEALPVIIGGHGRDAPDPAGMSFNGAIDEVKVFDEALTEEMIQAAMIPSGGSVPGGLEITDISVDQNSETVSLTFNSRPGKTYSLFWTPDLAGGPDYVEIDDSVRADSEQGQTTHRFPIPRAEDDPGGPPAPKAFFVISEN
jgi:hypothetical protein